MYTSRLPKSTSVKRPTGPGTGTTSFASFNRPSGIPVTVKKANLFTPQRTSTARKPFATDKKYQTTSKPAPDRDEQMRMFETMVDYIKVHAPQFPLPEARKFFSSVSTTESSRIFEFLIKQFFPDFKVTKLEKDIPEALTLLEYPYIRSVTKSALVSVTTRQAAVGLLVIFNWLVKRLKEIEHIDDDDDDDSEVDIGYECLKLCLYNGSDVDELKRNLLERLQPSQDSHMIESDLRATEEELDRVNECLDDYDECMQEIRTLSENRAKLMEYNSQMVKYTETKQEEEVKRVAKADLLDLDIEAQKQESAKHLREFECLNLTLEPERRVENCASGTIKYRDEIRPATKKAIERYERELADQSRQYEETMTELQANIEEAQRSRAFELKKHEDMTTALTNSIDSAKERLELKKAERQAVEKRNLKHLECNLQRDLQRLDTIVKDISREVQELAEIGKIAENNKNVAKRALKLFK